VLDAYAGELGVADRITILRGVSADDKPFLYRAADVFLSPVDNVQEMFGIRPVEAMACGIPQVVADWNGYRDLVARRDRLPRGDALGGLRRRGGAAQPAAQRPPARPHDAGALGGRRLRYPVHEPRSGVTDRRGAS
jgi:glycosyltransferase involved in cell wall biosynthesis